MSNVSAELFITKLPAVPSSQDLNQFKNLLERALISIDIATHVRTVTLTITTLDVSSFSARDFMDTWKQTIRDGAGDPLDPSLYMELVISHVTYRKLNPSPFALSELVLKDGSVEYLKVCPIGYEKTKVMTSVEHESCDAHRFTFSAYTAEMVAKLNLSEKVTNLVADRNSLIREMSTTMVTNI